MMLDPLYFMIVGPAILLAFWAQIKVKSAYGKYSRVGTASAYSGAEAAAEILRASGLEDVRIEPIPGQLTDNYDPRSRRLGLSQGVYQGRSIAAVGIAAHEAGHALQHARHYLPLQLRSAFFPAANLGSHLAIPLILLGSVLGFFGLVKAGIVLFSFAVVFQVITLPVELNASRRAKAVLTSSGIVAGRDEIRGVQTVLTAAAMTYLAATLVAVTQLLYFIMRSSRR